MLTESEILALEVLRNKFKLNANTFHPPKEIGEDEIFLSRSTNTYRPTISAGLVLGNLYRKGCVDLIVLAEVIHAPTRLYRINSNGLSTLERSKEVAMLELWRLEDICQAAYNHAGACFQELKEFKEKHGIR